VQTIVFHLSELRSKMEDVCRETLGDEPNDAYHIYFGNPDDVLEEDDLNQRVAHDEAVPDWRDVVHTMHNRLNALIGQCDAIGADVNPEVAALTKNLRDLLPRLLQL
jgi:hypothetical protein